MGTYPECLFVARAQRPVEPRVLLELLYRDPLLRVRDEDAVEQVAAAGRQHLDQVLDQRRADAVRPAVRDLLQQHLWEQRGGGS